MLEAFVEGLVFARAALVVLELVFAGMLALEAVAVFAEDLICSVVLV